ncbi:hypothetical protein GCM10009827_021750 [Dactylosporangium maewongense]|uniref:Protein kinase domain-containing protein n=1 Tax=Dactylosporangium maewongense TaxID=634393 RepID=A0ABN1ZYI7_9ACTN
MSSPAVTSVRLADLEPVGLLGDGGQGVVTQVRVPGAFPGPMAFKRYEPGVLRELEHDVLADMIAHPGHAGPGFRALLETQLAWPVALVRDEHDTVCGFLMPQAPEVFWGNLHLPNSAGTLTPVRLDYLLNPPEYTNRINLLTSPSLRLNLLLDAARMLLALHADDVVVGDLSPRNFLFTTFHWRCFLLDCDAMTVRGRSPLPPVETPDWQLPSGEPVGTKAGDRFKFGLMVIRVLCSDQSLRDPEELRPGFPALADLARQAQLAPDERPGWDEWIDAIEAAKPGASTAVVMPAPPAPVTAPPAPVTAPVPPPAVPLAPAPPVRPGGASRPLTMRQWAVFALVLVVVICIIGLVANKDHQRPADRSGTTSGSTPFDTGAGEDEPTAYPTRTQPTTAPAVPVAPSAVGIVTLPAGADGTAVAVGRMFDQYFTGINNRDWDATLAVYDPAGGIVHADNLKERSSFIDSMTTTTDDDVVLWSVQPGGAGVLARITFRSRQNAGFGPKGSENETCLRWDNTYSLSGDATGYRIYKKTKGTHAPCPSG